MKKKILLYSVVGVIAVILITLAAVSNNKGSSSGALVPSETFWNFGTVKMSEGIVTKELTLRNDSSEPVAIIQMETSCMCTNAQIIHENGKMSGVKGMAGHGSSTMSEMIEPNETVIVKINFDPNAHGPNGTGSIDRQVTIKTNSQDQPIIVLRFSGVVVK